MDDRRKIALERYVTLMDQLRPWSRAYFENMEELLSPDKQDDKDRREEVLSRMTYERMEMAKLIKEFQRENCDIKLCPRCNAIGDNGGVLHPERVGATLQFFTDIWQSYSGYDCRLCDYKDHTKIEHWE